MSKQSGESTNSATSTFLGVVVILLCLGVVGAMVSLFGSSRGGGGGGSSGGSSSGGGSSSDVVVIKPYEVGGGMYADKAQTFTFADGTHAGVTISENTVWNGNDSNGLWTTILNEDENDMLLVGKNATSNPSQLVWFDTNEASGSTYVFEADVKWLGSESGIMGVNDPNWYFKLAMATSGGLGNSEFLKLYFHGCANENLYYLTFSDSPLGEKLCYFRVNEWSNIRVEYTPGERTANLYVNNEFVTTFESAIDTVSDSTFGSLELENRGKAFDSIVILDNVYASAETTN